jgi:hypothetical protein
MRHLRTPRRPPPQAAELEGAGACCTGRTVPTCLDGAHENTIRRALEALDD